MEFLKDKVFPYPSQGSIEAANDAILADEELGAKIESWEKSTSRKVIENGIAAVKKRAQASPKGSPLRWVFLDYTRKFAGKRGDTQSYLWALAGMAEWDIPAGKNSPAAEAAQYFENEKPRISGRSAKELLPSLLGLIDFAVKSADPKTALDLYTNLEKLNRRKVRNQEIASEAADDLEGTLALTLDDESYETGKQIAEALQEYYRNADDRETSKKYQEVAAKMERLVKLSNKAKSGSGAVAATEKKVALGEVKKLLKALDGGTPLFADSSSLDYINSTDVKFVKIEEGTVEITCLEKQARACGVFDKSLPMTGPFKVTGTVRCNHDTRLTFAYDPKHPSDRLFVRLGPDSSFGEIHYVTRDDRDKGQTIVIAKPLQQVRLRPVGNGFYEFRFELVCNGPAISVTVNDVEVTRANLLQVPTKQGIKIPRTTSPGLVGVYTALLSDPPYKIVVSDLQVAKPK